MPGRTSSSSSQQKLPRFTSPLAPPVWTPSQQISVANTSNTSFLQTVKEGFGLGVGVSLGQRLVNSFFTKNPSCDSQQTLYNTCLQKGSSSCQTELDSLQKCLDKSPAAQ